MTDYSFNEFATIMINDKTLINDSNKIYNIKELFDGYIKFLMTKKYDNNVIKEYRAKTTIDYYIDFYCDNKKYDRNELIEQYKKNIIDKFGEQKWEVIISKLNDPEKLSKTHAHFIPNFLNLAIET